MTTTSLQPQDQDNTPTPPPFGRIHWVFLGYLFFITLALLALPVVLWFLTKSIYSLSSVVGAGPTIFFLWRRWASYLLPLSEGEIRYRLELAKIKHRDERRRRVQGKGPS